MDARDAWTRLEAGGEKLSHEVGDASHAALEKVAVRLRRFADSLLPPPHRRTCPGGAL